MAVIWEPAGDIHPIDGAGAIAGVVEGAIGDP
jgi:hypothetical protein